MLLNNFVKRCGASDLAIRRYAFTDGRVINDPYRGSCKKSHKSGTAGKTLSGMTLIEVTIGMAVIIIVTVIAYMGVSASANLSQHGTDLRNSDGIAVGMMEEAKRKAENQAEGEKPAVTEVVVHYKVDQIIYDSDGESEVTAVSVNPVVPSANVNAGLIEAGDGDVEYHMYLPK